MYIYTYLIILKYLYTHTLYMFSFIFMYIQYLYGCIYVHTVNIYLDIHTQSAYTHCFHKRCTILSKRELPQTYHSSQV